MKARRKALSPTARAAAARSIARQLLGARLVRRGQHVAAYLSVQAEADLSPFIGRAAALGVHLYLPRMLNLRSGRMEFRKFSSGKLVRNRLGIREPPAHAQRIAPRSLDRVLVPLLAFDAQGHRLGMGAGFYDRRFGFLRSGRRWRRPRLIGIAYEIQRLPALEPEAWDVPLDAIVTERRVYRIPHP